VLQVNVLATMTQVRVGSEAGGVEECLGSSYVS
jgi:hypothetical protein